MDKKTFQPPWWLSYSHAQTIWPTLCRKPLKHFLVERERVELPDGDFLDLDWTQNSHGPIVCMLHGFEGSIQSPYAKGMLQAIHQQGILRGYPESFDRQKRILIR